MGALDARLAQRRAEDLAEAQLLVVAEERAERYLAVALLEPQARHPLVVVAVDDEADVERLEGQDVLDALGVDPLQLQRAGPPQDEFVLPIITVLSNELTYKAGHREGSPV